eukprot:226052-Pleurochrysis_carterae.AAC.4
MACGITRGGAATRRASLLAAPRSCDLHYVTSKCKHNVITGRDLHYVVTVSRRCKLNNVPAKMCEMTKCCAAKLGRHLAALRVEHGKASTARARVGRGKKRFSSGGWRARK